MGKQHNPPVRIVRAYRELADKEEYTTDEVSKMIDEAIELQMVMNEAGERFERIKAILKKEAKRLKLEPDEETREMRMVGNRGYALISHASQKGIEVTALIKFLKGQGKIKMLKDLVKPSTTAVESAFGESIFYEIGEVKTDEYSRCSFRPTIKQK